MDISRLIKIELLKNNISVEQLAKKLGVTKQALYLKLHRNDMKISTIEEIADTLNCTVSLSFIPKTPSTQSDSQ